MNNYETVFIVTPVLSDAQVKEVADKFQGVITENGGQIVNSEAWGLKKLAYPRNAVPPRRADHPFLNFQAGQIRRRVLGETSCETF